MNRIYDIVKELNFERTAGSPNEKKAINIIAKYLKECDLDYELQSFEMNNYEPGTASIKCDGKTFASYPFGLESDAEIQGELVFLENPDSLLYDNISFENKIIISSKYSRQIVEALSIAKPEAFIVIGNPFKDASTRSHRQKSYVDGKKVPSISISYDIGAELSKLAGKTVNISIKQKVEKVTANNIVVNIPGYGQDRNIIYAVGHYDTVGRSAGACDNTGGSAVLLKLAKYFSENKPKRNIKIIWFSGEEMGLLGSQAYVKNNLDEIKQFGKFLVNIDVTGDDIGHNMYRILGTKETLGYINGISLETGFVFDSELGIYSSDNMPFSVYEIPSVSIARFGGKSSFHGHTADDKLEHITQRGLEITEKASIMMLNRLLNAEIFPLKKEIDVNLRNKIQKYMWNLTFEEPTLNWKKEYKK